MKAKVAIILSASILLISALFYFVYVYDNKYYMEAPYGKEGSIQLTEQDISSNRLIFLIDEWEFYKDKLYDSADLKGANDSPQYIFIGQYPNFTLMKGTSFTKATYRMIVNHQNTTENLFFRMPEVFTDYTLLIDGHPQNVKNGDIVSLGKNQRSEIILQIHDSKHYYDGLYYPFAVGSIQAIQRMSTINTTLYSGMLIFAMITFFFAITLRKHDEDHVFTVFAFMCLSFALYCLYPLLHRLLPTFSAITYRYEDVMNAFTILFLLRLCSIIVKVDRKKLYRRFILPFNFFVVACVIIIPSFLLSTHKELINTYGSFIDIFKWISSLYLFYCSYYAFRNKNIYAISILAGGTIFAMSQLFNFFFNNLYEPIYGCWQAEYGSFIIILLYFIIVLKRNHIMLKENAILNEHLEVAIEKRTKEIEQLLEERKVFFSNVAHDLKAPLGAIQNYTRLIEQNNLHLDNEIRSYLQSIERKNQLMNERISALQQITQLDKTQDSNTSLSINQILQSFYKENQPEADALGIHFNIQLLEEDCHIYGQKEKLSILLENLFYNALSFTAYNGLIEVIALKDEKFVRLSFKDSGTGIEEEDLPHIFERFYSKRANESDKSGLGLYIVNMIVKEMHGSILVESQVKQGTTFYIQLPIHQKILKTPNDAFQF